MSSELLEENNFNVRALYAKTSSKSENNIADINDQLEATKRINNQMVMSPSVNIFPTQQQQQMTKSPPKRQSVVTIVSPSRQSPQQQQQLRSILVNNGSSSRDREQIDGESNVGGGGEEGEYKRVSVYQLKEMPPMQSSSSQQTMTEQQISSIFQMEKKLIAYSNLIYSSETPALTNYINQGSFR